jgi:hypothetical protein
MYARDGGELLLTCWEELSHEVILLGWNFEDSEGSEMSSSDSSAQEWFLQLKLEQDSGMSDDEDPGEYASEDDITEFVGDPEAKYGYGVC